MQHPVFISMGGESDATYAKEIQHSLGDQLAYHYQETGEEGVKFRSEIEAAIQNCKLFVVIWSEDYLKSAHAKNELAFFRKITESSKQEKKELLVIPREQGKPDIQSKWKNPITQKEEPILGAWNSLRSMDAGVDAQRAANFIKKQLGSIDVIHDVLIPRGWLIDKLKQIVVLPDFQARELLFISGLEGFGRRTLLAQYMEQAYKHRTARKIILDSVDGPEDFLIPLMDAASLSMAKRREILNTIKQDPQAVVKEIRKILHDARCTKSYYVVNIARFVGADLGNIPQWMPKLFEVFKTGAAPIVFIITSNPVSEALLKHFPKSEQLMVPGLEDAEMDELVYKLSIEDSVPERWTKAKRDQVARACGSSPSLCKSVMYALRTEKTLDFVDKIARRAEENFGAALASLMAHWISIYSDRLSDLMALRIIEKLGLTSKEALDEILQTFCQKHGDYDLYSLRAQGLVEQLTDGLYRIPPLIQRRLHDALWSQKSGLTIDADNLLKLFSKQVEVAKTEYGAIYAANAITATLRTGSDRLAPEYEGYLTVSMLFKAGLDRYSNNQFKDANHILQRAMKRLEDNRGVVDTNTKIEIARFAGLAGARDNDKSTVSRSCDFLEKYFSDTKRQYSALAMSFFLKGFEARLGRLFIDSKDHYLAALHHLRNDKFANRQRGAIYTELAAVYLRLTPPNYAKALDYAKLAYEQNDVTHTLSAYVHTLIAYTFRSATISANDLGPYIDEIEALLARLDDRCAELSLEFSALRRKEYEREHRRWEELHQYARGPKSRFSLPPDSEFAPTELQFL